MKAAVGVEPRICWMNHWKLDIQVLVLTLGMKRIHYLQGKVNVVTTLIFILRSCLQNTVIAHLYVNKYTPLRTRSLEIIHFCPEDFVSHCVDIWLNFTCSKISWYLKSCFEIRSQWISTTNLLNFWNSILSWKGTLDCLFRNHFTSRNPLTFTMNFSKLSLNLLRTERKMKLYPS